MWKYGAASLELGGGNWKPVLRVAVGLMKLAVNHMLVSGIPYRHQFGLLATVIPTVDIVRPIGAYGEPYHQTSRPTRETST